MLLRSEPTTFLEDFVTTEYTLYEILGDSIMPRQTIFPYKGIDLFAYIYYTAIYIYIYLTRYL